MYVLQLSTGYDDLVLGVFASDAAVRAWVAEHPIDDSHDLFDRIADLYGRDCGEPIAYGVVHCQDGLPVAVAVCD